MRFSTAMRGYDRDEVDRYVQRVNQVLAELQITKTPELAIQRALEGIEEEKQAVIEEAHRTAEEITARSRARADDRVEEATREAEKMRELTADEALEIRAAAGRDAQRIREAAEERVRELEADAEAILERRNRVIEELRALADTLGEVVEAKDGGAADSDPTPVESDAAG